MATVLTTAVALPRAGGRLQYFLPTFRLRNIPHAPQDGGMQFSMTDASVYRAHTT